MRRVFRTSASLLGIALGCAVAQGAAAQSVDIPLNYTLNTIRNFGGSIPGPVVILTINVGVNGGAAQAYAFDTGSAVFLTPNGVFSGANRVASNVDIDTYGGVHTFSGDLHQIPASSLKFYAAPEATSGGVLLSSSGVYNVGSYKKLDGGNPGMQPFGKAVVGAFGADPQAFSITPSGGMPIGMGGIFGQTLLPNTTPGYVVSANGQSHTPLTVTINSGGTLAPGTPGGFGTLTIDGTLLFNAGSFYAINIAPGAGNNSKTAVVGSATLGGNGTVVMTPQLGHTKAQSIRS
jgi:hypothetical protein